jgi:hypothetical protein
MQPKPWTPHSVVHGMLGCAVKTPQGYSLPCIDLDQAVERQQSHVAWPVHTRRHTTTTTSTKACAPPATGSKSSTQGCNTCMSCRPAADSASLAGRATKGLAWATDTSSRKRRSPVHACLLKVACLSTPTTAPFRDNRMQARPFAKTIEQPANPQQARQDNMLLLHTKPAGCQNALGAFAGTSCSRTLHASFMSMHVYAH